jgi:NAD(P)-dependent dehydrogenase (short-subunit alcohol dehydrogenase family)
MTDPLTALVTGANKGLGKEVARQLGQLGATVLIASRDRSRGELVAAELAAEGIETNVFGVLAVTRAMLPLMGKAPAPRIVNVASTTASLTYNAGPDAMFAGAPNNLAYAASKSAVTMLTVQYANALPAQPRASALQDQRSHAGAHRHRPERQPRPAHSGTGCTHRGGAGHLARRRPERRLLQRRRPVALVSTS